jgi:hypothetical protein
MNPNRWGGAIRGNLHNNNLVLTLKGENLQPAKVNEQFDIRLNEIEEYLGYQRSIADTHRQSLPPRLRPDIEARKQKLLDTRKMVAGLAFPIRTRQDAAKTYVAPVNRKTIQVQRPKTTQAFEPEPTLAEGDYQHVLSVIEDMTKTMERNPTTFAKLDEEALRDMYLVPLNGHFEGAATGETFNAAGKTDILIRVEDRNIFIGECKIWRGSKYLTEAIDQLLSYLTWRDTKTAIIIFNRNKGLSGVLSSMQETMAAHPQLKHGPKIEGETRFRYVFGNPADSNREVIVTVLVFDVPT